LIFPIVRTALVALRRDRVSLVLSFVVPIAFFSIFAVIFGGQHDTVPRVKVIVVDEDQSRASQQLVKGLESDGSLVVTTRPAPTKSQSAPSDLSLIHIWAGLGGQSPLQGGSPAVDGGGDADSLVAHAGH